jgi:hypothetical protein
MSRRGNATRAVLTVFLTSAIASADASSSSKNGAKTDSACLVDNGMGGTVEAMPTPSLLDVLIHPDRYDRCVVIVLGYFTMHGVTTGRLLLSSEDRQAGGSLFGAVPIYLRNGPARIPNNELRRAEGKIVLVQGRFFAKSKTSAAHIGEIERFEIPNPPGGTR